MSFNANVQKALSLVSAGLDPHIQTVLTPHLGGLEWPVVLQELDKNKGHANKTYVRSDVQCQLRMITERLGNLGFPFDSADSHRKMSIYGSELRLVRNRWAHQDEFSALEAMRAVDTAFLLLTAIGDHERAELAAAERTALLYSLVQPKAGEPQDGDDEPEEEPPLDSAPEEALADDEGPGWAARRINYEPWQVVVTGQIETLDNLPKKAAKESVRATIEEIVASEGPIHKDRLTKLVGYSYGLDRVRELRAKKILAQVKASACVIDSHGFVWPEAIEQERWSIFRSCSAGSARNFLEISPREIANAAQDRLSRAALEMTEGELRSATLAVFGRSKASQNFRKHFDKALRLAVAEGLIMQDAASGTYMTGGHA